MPPDFYYDSRMFSKFKSNDPFLAKYLPRYLVVRGDENSEIAKFQSFFPEKN